MMSASIFMTVAIAMERYVAVHYPVDYNQVINEFFLSETNSSKSIFLYIVYLMVQTNLSIMTTLRTLKKGSLFKGSMKKLIQPKRVKINMLFCGYILFQIFQSKKLLNYLQNGRCRQALTAFCLLPY